MALKIQNNDQTVVKKLDLIKNDVEELTKMVTEQEKTNKNTQSVCGKDQRCFIQG